LEDDTRQRYIDKVEEGRDYVQKFMERVHPEAGVLRESEGDLNKVEIAFYDSIARSAADQEWTTMMNYVQLLAEVSFMLGRQTERESNNVELGAEMDKFLKEV
jgi:hypothetical protein